MRLLGLIIALLILAIGGLTGYAYLGDMNAAPKEMRVPVQLDLGAEAPAAAPAPAAAAETDAAPEAGTEAEAETDAAPAPASSGGTEQTNVLD